MFELSNRPNRIAIGTTITIAIVISCLGIVRAQRFAVAEAGGRYNCSTGRACVEGNSTGMPYGVYGTSSGGNGVEGRSGAVGRAGASGLHVGNGIGVYAESHDTSGKYAALFARADESTTNIFFGYNRATHASCQIDPAANLTCNGIIEAGGPGTKSVGVTGNSDQSYGVEGVSTNSDGVHGITSSTTGNAAVAGIATGTSGSSNGVYGSSSNGYGIYGTSAAKTSAVAVYGSTVATGGTGLEGSGFVGVEGENGSGGDAGVLGVDNSGQNAVLGETINGTAFYASTAGGNLFFGTGPGGYCRIDGDANLYCSGTITGGKPQQSRHRTSSGRNVIAYESESTSATIEDFGTARIVRGAADVPIEPTFASAIDRSGAYYVFLTPLGDTRGLYVSRKTPSGFQVRETDGGHSSLGFDYRIVAHPIDADNGRLPQAPAIKIPRAPHVSIPRTINGSQSITRH